MNGGVVKDKNVPRDQESLDKSLVNEIIECG
jgi:hypothetical protein